MFDGEYISGAGVEPDVQNVVHLFELPGVMIVAEEPLRRRIEPRVCAFMFERLDDARIDALVIENLPAFAVYKNRNGNAPGALPRQNPVRPAFDHGGNA